MTASREVTIVHTSPGRRVRIEGGVGVATADAVRGALSEAIDSGDGDLRVDLSRAEVLDSTALGVLVGAHHRATSRGRRLVLVSCPDRLEALLAGAPLGAVLTRDAA